MILGVPKHATNAHDFPQAAPIDLTISLSRLLNQPRHILFLVVILLSYGLDTNMSMRYGNYVKTKAGEGII